MSDITCITSFLNIPTLTVSILTIIYLTYFTCICDISYRFIRGKELSYVIGLLPIFFKQLYNVIQGTISSPNSKSLSSHTPYTIFFLSISVCFFRIGNFSSFHHKVLFHLSAGSSFSLITVSVS